MPHESIFVFIWYFIGVILLKNSCQKWGVRKKDKKEGWSYSGEWRGWGRGIYRRGIKPSAHYALKCFKTKLCDKLVNTTFVYLLCSIMPLCLTKTSTVGQIMRHKMLLFGAKLDTNHPFALAGDFFEKLTDVNFVYFM